MFNLLLPLWLAVVPVTEDCVAGCRADFNDDGVISTQDLQSFLQFYDGIVDENTELVDLNCDGNETVTDYVIFLSFYGQHVDALGCD